MLKIDFSRESSTYEIVIGHDLLKESGKWARKCLGRNAAKIAIVSNPKVFKLYGKLAEASLRDAGFTVSHFLMRDGERHKNLRTAESALRFFAASGLTRTDAVVALGGGVVGDLAGFAAAIYLRGISYLQIPTTILSMIDSSVGGKTGVNSTAGKNLTGSFHQPSGVLIDTATLKTLAEQEICSGFYEAVKHGAIGSRKLFRQISDFLTKFPPSEIKRACDDKHFQMKISELITSQIAFKAKIVAGDERESSTGNNAGSRKILNFGHTLAHALEKATNYRQLTHGEAVGYGILYAAELSKTLALCDPKDVKLLNDVVHGVGSLPRLANIDEKEVLEAFRFDKKNIASSLQMVLLKAIGKPVILTEREISRSAMQKVLNQLLQKWA